MRISCFLKEIEVQLLPVKTDFAMPVNGCNATAHGQSMA